MRCKSPTSIIFSKTAGFIVFIIILIIANFVTSSITNQVYRNIIQFFNLNIVLFLVLFLIGMINEIFWSFNFPFNLLAPITSSILSVFVITFFYRIWEFINFYANSGVIIPIYAIYTLVAIIVFISGYATIIMRGGKTKEEFKLSKEKIKIVKELKHKKKGNQWKDLEEEFKLVFYNIGDAFNKIFESNDKKRRKRK